MPLSEDKLNWKTAQLLRPPTTSHPQAPYLYFFNVVFLLSFDGDEVGGIINADPERLLLLVIT